jgi:hypothetical protein
MLFLEMKTFFTISLLFIGFGLKSSIGQGDYENLTSGRNVASLIPCLPKR